MTQYVLYSGSNEWSAFYVDGDLEYVGDHDNVHEHMFTVLGIDVRNSDDFIRGGDQREHVAKTLVQAEGYTLQREILTRRADGLREEADLLRQQAEELDERAKELES